MKDLLKFGEIINDNLSSREKVKFSILGNRLGLSAENAKRFLNDIQLETSKIFSIPESEVFSDIDFSGRDFDFVLTINKNNLPDNKE